MYKCNDDRCVIDRLPHTYHFYKKKYKIDLEKLNLCSII
nr:MAG TPA: hypothetical protein [Caudoviricetes sp.]